MKIGDFDTDRRVLLIAEVGNNHEGSYSLAEEMVGRAAEAGVDAVKFQTIVPERLVSPREEKRLAALRRFQFSYEQFAGLADTARRAGVLFLSTPFDMDSARFLTPLVPAFKIASGAHPQVGLLDRNLEGDEICRLDPFSVGPFPVFFHDQIISGCPSGMQSPLRLLEDRDL